MKRQIRKCFALVIVLLILFTNVVNATEINITNTTSGKYHNPEAIRVPETNINDPIKTVKHIGFDLVSFMVTFAMIYVMSFLFISNFIFFGKKNRRGRNISS